MNFESELLMANKRLAKKGIKLRIEQRGNKLGLRGKLPSQKDPNQTKDQRISLGLDINTEGLSKAEKTVDFLSLQIEHNQFNWENWSKHQTQKPLKNNHVNLDKIIKKFQSSFFDDPNKNKSESGSKTNWESAYLPYLRRLKSLANNNYSLNQNLFIDTLSTYEKNSRSRQQCGTSLKAFAKYLNFNLPDNWKEMSYGYGLNKAQFRDLPSDDLIMRSYHLIPNPRWKLVYGLMATYGLRNHEVFFSDLSSLSLHGDKILRVLPNTKTGEHQVWPFHPEWIDTFNLKKLSYEQNSLPDINTDLTQTTLQNVGRRVSEQFKRYNLPMTPYDLRHAWAIRTIHIGLPDTVSARMMGHSVAIHTRTYHHWITKRDQQQAVDKELKGTITKT